jgi:putative effector of murein hydrolase LrgA (UPF0299 family)
MKTKSTNTHPMPGNLVGLVVLMVTLSAGWVVLMTISQLAQSMSGILPS